jgi:hypothetical protein
MGFQKTTAQQLKRDLRRRKQRGLALDIDDTLSYTDYYWFEQMRLRFSNPEKLSHKRLIEKYKRISNVPYWQTEKAGKFMGKLFYSNKFQAAITPVRKASTAINKINKKTPIVAYITARPVAVYGGTKKWLIKNRFPDAPIVLLPKSLMQRKRHAWKARLLKFLYPEVLGIIDDHPSLKRELKPLRYKGALLLYNNGRNTKYYHHRLKRFENWKEIQNQIKALARAKK